MSAPVNLFYGMGDFPTKFVLASAKSEYWFAAKCRRRECPLDHTPFDCPFFQKPCPEVSPADWASICISEEEDHGDNS